jgi:lactate dehydrogenase-like 2-hydroxyacid dehydrogenase
MKTIVLARPMPDTVVRFAQAHFDACVPDHVLNGREVIAALQAHRAEALVFGSNLRVDAALVDALPASVRVVATTSVGYDHVDVAALRARNIAAAYVPHAVTQCTADLTVMLLLCAARRAKEYQSIASNGWGRKFGFDEFLGTRVSGKRLGIVGMGRIGQAVAKRAAAFDMEILYHDVRKLDTGYRFFDDLREMLPHCDFITLHAPGNGQAILDEATLHLLPRGAIVVNAARGSLIDEAALLRALESGQVAAAGLDTFCNEPNIDTRLTRHERVFATPHMGTATVETRSDMGIRALQNVKAVLDGGSPLDPL